MALFPIAKPKAHSELLLVLRTASRHVMSKNNNGLPTGGFTLSQRSGRERRSRPQGSPGARKGHAGQI